MQKLFGVTPEAIAREAQKQSSVLNEVNAVAFAKKSNSPQHFQYVEVDYNDSRFASNGKVEIAQGGYGIIYLDGAKSTPSVAPFVSFDGSELSYFLPGQSLIGEFSRVSLRVGTQVANAFGSFLILKTPQARFEQVNKDNWRFPVFKSGAQVYNSAAGNVPSGAVGIDAFGVKGVNVFIRSATNITGGSIRLWKMDGGADVNAWHKMPNLYAIPTGHTHACISDELVTLNSGRIYAECVSLTNSGLGTDPTISIHGN